MLPGFRFLFATVVLAGAILIFGLGAAALLRAAHEEFASLPSWRTAPQPLPARMAGPAPPTLALLRVEPPETVERTAIEKDMAPIALPDEQSAAAEHAVVAPEATEAVKPEEIAAVPAVSGISAEAPASAVIEASLQPASTDATAAGASLPTPAKATAAAQPGKPAAVKARQAAARAAARRRLIIARAAARARAIQQQKQKTLDPLSQLFGGG